MATEREIILPGIPNTSLSATALPAAQTVVAGSPANGAEHRSKELKALDWLVKRVCEHESLIVKHMASNRTDYSKTCETITRTFSRNLDRYRLEVAKIIFDKTTDADTLFDNAYKSAELLKNMTGNGRNKQYYNEITQNLDALGEAGWDLIDNKLSGVGIINEAAASQRRRQAAAFYGSLAEMMPVSLESGLGKIMEIDAQIKKLKPPAEVQTAIRKELIKAFRADINASPIQNLDLFFDPEYEKILNLTDLMHRAAIKCSRLPVTKDLMAAGMTIVEIAESKAIERKDLNKLAEIIGILPLESRAGAWKVLNNDPELADRLINCRKYGLGNDFIRRRFKPPQDSDAPDSIHMDIVDILLEEDHEPKTVTSLIKLLSIDEKTLSKPGVLNELLELSYKNPCSDQLIKCFTSLNAEAQPNKIFILFRLAKLEIPSASLKTALKTLDSIPEDEAEAISDYSHSKLLSRLTALTTSSTTTSASKKGTSWQEEAGRIPSLIERGIDLTQILETLPQELHFRVRSMYLNNPDQFPQFLEHCHKYGDQDWFRLFLGNSRSWLWYLEDVNTDPKSLGRKIEYLASKEVFGFFAIVSPEAGGKVTNGNDTLNLAPFTPVKEYFKTVYVFGGKISAPRIEALKQIHAGINLRFYPNSSHHLPEFSSNDLVIIMTKDMNHHSSLINSVTLKAAAHSAGAKIIVIGSNQSSSSVSTVISRTCLTREEADAT